MGEPVPRRRSPCLRALSSRREAELACDQAQGLGKMESRAWSPQVACSWPLKPGWGGCGTQNSEGSRCPSPLSGDHVLSRPSMSHVHRDPK